MRPDPGRPWSFVPIGLALYGGVAALIVVAWLWEPSWGRGALNGMVTEVFAGREAGIPVALSAGTPAMLVFAVSLVQDVAAFFLTFPVFLWVLHRYHDQDNVFMRRVRHIEAAASRHQAYVRRWGPLGIFLFMLTPFLVNGPLVGGVVGRLAGIPTRRLLVPVIAATAVAAALWVFLFDQTIQRLESVDPRLGYAVAGVVVVGLVSAGAVGLIRDERKHRATLAMASGRPADVGDSEE